MATISDPVIVLIHGVGNDRRGSMHEAALRALRSEGIAADVHEFHWHELAGYSVAGSGLLAYRISPGYLTAVMAAMRGVACASPGADGLLARFFTWLLSASINAFVLLCCFWPLMMFVTPTPEIYVALLTWTSAIGVPSLVFALLFGVGRKGKEAPFLRRIAFVVLRPILWVLCLPFLVKPAGAALSILEMGLMSLACVLALIYARDGVLARWFAEGAVLGLLAITALGFAGALLLATVLGPTLKIIADICRYAGDVEYRDRIHASLCEVADALPGGPERRLILVGHSLGSVIAVNSLLREDSPWRGRAEVVLVSMGSPLRRFFWTFFPDQSPDPVELCRTLVGSNLVSAWLNVSRPFDPIGTRLSPRGDAGPIMERSTSQFSRLLVWAHTGYWGDRLVVRTIASALRSLPLRSQELASPPVPLFGSWPGERSSPALFHKLLGAAFCCWALGHSIYDDVYARPSRLASRSAARIEWLRERGAMTEGTVQHRPQLSPRAVDGWGLQFQPESGKPVTDAFSGNLLDSEGVSTDIRSLRRAVPHGGAIKVRVTYDPRKPQVYVLSDFPPPTQSASYEISLWSAVAATLWLRSPLFLALALLGMAGYSTYAGLDWRNPFAASATVDGLLPGTDGEARRGTAASPSGHGD